MTSSTRWLFGEYPECNNLFRTVIFFQCYCSKLLCYFHLYYQTCSESRKGLFIISETGNAFGTDVTNKSITICESKSIILNWLIFVLDYTSPLINWFKLCVHLQQSWQERLWNDLYHFSLMWFSVMWNNFPINSFLLAKHRLITTK